MHAQQDYPRVTAVLDVVADWVKHRRTHGHNLDRLPDAEVAKIAGDLGLSPADLRALDRLADQPLQLPQMLEALHVDANALSRAQPLIVRDLERVCALCDAKKRCARELAAGDAAVTFEDLGRPWCDPCGRPSDLSPVSCINCR
jgi:hypothetical protein